MLQILRISLAVLFVWWSQKPQLAAEIPQGVLLITVDSLRADYLGCNGSSKVDTPNIDRLASGGVNFRRARSPVPLTLPAHASILTASYPPTHGVRSNLTERLPDGTTTLAGIIENKGYRSIAAIASFLLDRRFGLDEGFEVYDDRVWHEIEEQEQETGERAAGEMLQAFRTWIGLVDSHQRFFFWLHFNDPSFPYEPPEPFRSRYSDDLYAGEIAYVDSVVGELLSELERRGRLDSTLIALVGDHGEGLGDHGENSHSLTIYNEVLHVPLIVHSKGQIASDSVVDDLVRTIDLAPTILDLLAIDVAMGEGVSLVPFLSPRSNTEVGDGLEAYSESLFGLRRLGWAPAFGLERGDYRLIDTGSPELFRVVEDPNEMRSVTEDHPEMVKALRARLGDIMVSAETDFSPSNLAVWGRIEAGIEAIRLGDAAAALESLAPILDQNPSIPLVYELIGRSLLAEGDVAKAEQNYQLALERGVETAEIRRELGKIYLDCNDLGPSDLGLNEPVRNNPASRDLAGGELAGGGLAGGGLAGQDLGQAESNLRRAVELNELDARAKLYLAESLRRSGRQVDATVLFRQAIDLNKTYLPAWMGLGRALLESGQPEAALAAYRRALDVDPDNLIIGAAIEKVRKDLESSLPHSDR